MITLRSELRRKLLTFFCTNRSARVYVRQLASALDVDSPICPANWHGWSGKDSCGLRSKVGIQTTIYRQTGIQVLREGRLEWADEEAVSVHAIVVSVLEEFFIRLQRSKALREELRLEIRARRVFLPT